MSNYPNSFDDDSTLPAVNDNITDIGGEAINALRDAVLQIEQTLGTNINGSSPSLAARLGVFINPDGSPNASVLTSLGLVTLPIRNDQIVDNAGIPESKLHLDFRTQDLYNYIRDLSKDINTTLGWINTEGVKLEPHLMGAIYRHTMDQIDVSSSSADFLSSVLRALRNNTNSYTLVEDMNNELLAHQWTDGSPFGTSHIITTNNGSSYTTYYAHVGSGIFIDTSRFNNIPQTLQNLQLFADFIDSSSIFLLGSRIQNLYTNGISRISQSSSLITDGYGQFVVPPTSATAFLLNIGNSSIPYDDIDSGDDIVQFNPSTADQNSSYFDSLFSLVKPGDIIRVHYGDGYNIEVPYVIKEKKYNPTPGNKKYIVRIAGKNQAYSPNAIARIDRPLSNKNKYGELSISPANNQFGEIPSLIINNPRGAQVLGLGFDADQFDETHYQLYLSIYPTGVATDGYVFLPGIDVTGNKGTTPGAYTLDSIVQNTNNVFRAVGYNYRFTAFSFEGEFGICLADSYNNAAFSIISAAIAPNGSIDTLDTGIHFPNNVISLVPTTGTIAPDPLGFGPNGSGVASPPFMTSFGSSAAAINATKLFVALRRNNYYVNGSETERLAIETSQALDAYGDGYWVGTVQDVIIQVGRVQTTYRIPLDLDNSDLRPGKTLVVQQLGSGGAGTFTDFGRFIIKSVNFNCEPNVYTDITVYDAVHAAGFSPTATIQPFSTVAIYFSDDSVSFNTESSTDFSAVTPFKRHFEVYVDQNGSTFTHERGRLNASGSTLTVNTVPLYGYSQLNKWDIIKISPKLRGYQFGSVNKITLRMFNFSALDGTYDGYLSSYDGTNYQHYGPRIHGKKGAITRFYDETNIDYIDVLLDPSQNVSDFTDQLMDFQLFPSLQLDTQLMLLGTCQLDDTIKSVSRIVDGRQFGNISEKDLSSSVFDHMSIPEKYLHSNGVVRGFDVYQTFNGASANVYLSGGVVLVDGKFISLDNDVITIPAVKELFSSSLFNVNWIICVNYAGDYKLVPLLDFDSVLETPFAPSRYFVASDVVSSTSYNLVGSLFSDLISNRTDLTPLYIASSTVTGTTSPNVNITIKDARKHVYKSDWGQRPVLTPGLTIGDFQTFDSLGSWLNYNGTYESSVTVKGAFSFVPTSFSYAGSVKFYGDGTTSFAINSTTAINNISLQDLSVTTPSSGAEIDATLMNWTNVQFSGKSTFTATQGVFKNCIFNITRDVSSSSIFQFNNALIDNCIFNLNGATLTFDNCHVTNSTIATIAGNFSSIVAQGDTDTTAVFAGNKIQVGAASTTMQLQGQIKDNYFGIFANGCQIILTDRATFSGNYMTAANGISLSCFLQINDATNGMVINNFFYRNTNTLANGYIQSPFPYTSGVWTFQGNFYDHGTIDGTNQNIINSTLFLAADLQYSIPIPWIFKDNLNIASVHRLRVIAGASYAPAPDDYIICPELLSNSCTINLPLLSTVPIGRMYIIKDIFGAAGTNPIILHAAQVFDTIESLTLDYTFNIPFGVITIISMEGGWILL